MNNLYTKILNIYLEATNETLIEQQFMNLGEPSVKTTLKPESMELKNIKKSLRKTYGSIKSSTNPYLENLYRNFKKDLRRAQRKEQYLKEQNEINNLDRTKKQKCLLDICIKIE